MRELSLDETATREAANDDPAGFVAGLGGPAFIDEIQRAPDLLLELKKAVDADTVPGRFVITGSANVLASKKILDALPGRIDRFTLWPLAQTEIEDGRINFVDALFSGEPPQVTGPHRPAGLRGSNRRRRLPRGARTQAPAIAFAMVRRLPRRIAGARPQGIRRRPPRR